MEGIVTSRAIALGFTARIDSRVITARTTSAAVTGKKQAVGISARMYSIIMQGAS